jgi:hypothetical protein
MTATSTFPSTPHLGRTLGDGLESNRSIAAPPFRLASDRPPFHVARHAAQSLTKGPPLRSSPVNYRQSFPQSCAPAALAVIIRELFPELPTVRPGAPDPIETKFYAMLQQPMHNGQVSEANIARLARFLGLQTTAIVEPGGGLADPMSAAATAAALAAEGFPVRAPFQMTHGDKTRRIAFVKAFGAITGQEIGDHALVVRPGDEATPPSIMDPAMGQSFPSLAALNAAQGATAGIVYGGTVLTLDLRRP